MSNTQPNKKTIYKKPFDLTFTLYSTLPICYHFSFFLVADVWRSNDGKALKRLDKLG